MVDSFLDTLRARREAARKRVADAHQAVASAEAELRKWADAVLLEEKSSAANQGSETGSATEQLMVLTLDSVRRREDILRAAMRTAKKPLRPSEILKLVKPALSRSSVYLLINQMRDSGEVKELPGGKFIFQEGNTKG
jgi:hypothetical protein